MTEIKNAVLGSVKKPYEKPEIESIDLDIQAPLLAHRLNTKQQMQKVTGCQQKKNIKHFEL